MAIPVGHHSSQVATCPFQAWLLQCTLGFLHQARTGRMGMGGHRPERTVSDKQTLQIFKAEGRGKGKRKKKKPKHVRIS